MTKWSADEIPDLAGRTAVVTGANSGIGFHTALELARHGARVVIGCRRVERGEDALARMAALGAGSRLELVRLDLADLASVRAFASETLQRLDGLDLLVNNAGLMATPYDRTADGFELQLGVNHLGHFALTGLLMPALVARSDSRVVTVSSTAHRIGHINFDDLHSERGYRKWQAYGQSKLANLLCAFELDRRARAAGAALVSVAAHPGWASTELQTKGPRMAGNALMERLSSLGNRVIGQSAAAGALPILYAATAQDVRGGEYFGPDSLFESRGAPTRVKARPAAYDEVAARRLWEVSQQLTGVEIDLTRSRSTAAN